MTTEPTKPSVHEAMARFRASLVRRASAVAWVILAIVGAQAVRTEVYADSTFYIPMIGLVLLVATLLQLRVGRNTEGHLA